MADVFEKIKFQILINRKLLAMFFIGLLIGILIGIMIYINEYTTCYQNLVRCGGMVKSLLPEVIT